MREIIFGVNAEINDIKRIQELVKENNFKNVTYKKVELSNQAYKLNIVDL